MTLGEVNKGAVILILVLLFGAGGYLWYSTLYKPAVAARESALKSATTAEGTLTAAKGQLEQAQAAIDASKKESAKLDDSVARLAKARTAVPPDQLIDDAAIVLMEQAQKAGIQTSFKGGDESGGGLAASATTGETSLDGATPIDLEFKAAGTYSEMMAFMQLAEASVEEKDDKLFTRGRLFNIVKLKIGEDKEEDSGSSGGFGEDSGSSGADDNGFILGPNDLIFKVTVRMYSSSTGNAAGVGEATPDPAASATDPASGGATDGAAGGTTSTDPAAAGGSTTSTDPSAAAPADAAAATGGST